MKLLKIFSLAIFLIGLINFVQAQGYEQLSDVISSGGEYAEGGIYSNFGVVGETFVHVGISGADYCNSIGFLLDDPICIQIGSSEIFVDNKVHLFPNPTSGILNIDYQFIGGELIEVYNAQGVMVFSGRCKAHINISSVCNGLYLIVLKDKKGIVIFIEKIIKY